MKPETIKIDNLLRKKFFILPSASVYGSTSGLYDFGPYGTLLKRNLMKVWRRLFITSDTFEIEPCILTPFDVLKASGHVDKFCDLLIFDLVNGECYRADHFLEKELSKLENNEEVFNILSNIEKLSPKDIDDICLKFNLKSEANNAVGNCKHFNLMFETIIGPKSTSTAYLRPETAQGQFVNFKKLYELNNGKLPFASACFGKVFRNEISPRSGLLRVREFEQAEIEYFTYPDEKFIKDFEKYSSLELNLLFLMENEENQKIRKMNLKEAVDKKIIDNEIIGYFIGKTYIFLKEIGIDMQRVRFRQHKKDEMAHYANDCWDAEIETTYGWIECVGIADRGCFDLKMHQEFSGKDFTAKRSLKEPIEKENLKLIYNKKEVAKLLKDEMKNFNRFVDELSQEEIKKLIDKKKINFNEYEIEIEVRKDNVKIHVEDILPHVIEPSFGIGRILYALIEHSFYVRKEDSERNVLKFNGKVAPIQSVCTTLIKGNEYEKMIENIEKSFNDLKMKFTFCDRNVSIGKKYASYDEIGVPFFITIDSDSLIDFKCTIRERDSMEQIRVLIEDVAQIIFDLCEEKKSWSILK
ncbi:hypothetical protein GVAV_002031 [Gurleya vavrai]